MKLNDIFCETTFTSKKLKSDTLVDSITISKQLGGISRFEIERLARLGKLPYYKDKSGKMKFQIRDIRTYFESILKNLN